jgi:ATPase family associated with various cellular activities (AAA)
VIAHVAVGRAPDSRILPRLMSAEPAPGHSPPSETVPDTRGARPRTVVVVGDWIVDEYWFLRPCISQVASSRGLVHYESASDPLHAIRDLCGAGHVAHILYNSLGPSAAASEVISSAGTPAPWFSIIGIGSWNSKDTELLRHLVHADKDVACPAPTMGLSLCVGAEVCPDPPSARALAVYTTLPDGPTLRVTRLYRSGSNGLEQINRVDQVRTVSGEDATFPGPWQPSSEVSVEAVVVHDMGKGTVTPELIRNVQAAFASDQWYVRSKTPNPPWVRQVADRVKLLVVGPELLTDRNPLDTWLVNDRVTPQALDTIAYIGEHTPNAAVAILTDAHQLIARVGNGQRCVTAHSTVEPTAVSQLRWPSAVFASLVRQHIPAADPVTKDSLARAVEESSDLSGIPNIDVPTHMLRGVKPAGVRLVVVEETPWAEEVRDWNQAGADHGLITDDEGNSRLEVWRGSPLLPGYITCVDERKEVVLRLGRLLKEFVSTRRPSRSLSILLQADPGTGKTALAQSLAASVGARFLSYNVTSMARREDLIGVFDSVGALQARDDSPVVVFIDEINARLEGGPVFDAFLAPIEERKYFRQGRDYLLRPCAWIFAGTGTRNDGHDRADKYSDFRGRITAAAEIAYKSISQLYDDSSESMSPDEAHLLGEHRTRVQGQAKLEQVYLGAAIIGGELPHVTRVTKEVLDVFHDFDPGGRTAPSRRIRGLVHQIREVHGETLSKANCERWKGVYWSGDESSIDLVF